MSTSATHIFECTQAAPPSCCLNDSAPMNMLVVPVTFDTSHLEMHVSHRLVRDRCSHSICITYESKHVINLIDWCVSPSLIDWLFNWLYWCIVIATSIVAQEIPPSGQKSSSSAGARCPRRRPWSSKGIARSFIARYAILRRDILSVGANVIKMFVSTALVFWG